jgi:hypothetical protein
MLAAISSTRLRHFVDLGSLALSSCIRLRFDVVVDGGARAVDLEEVAGAERDHNAPAGLVTKAACTSETPQPTGTSSAA